MSEFLTRNLIGNFYDLGKRKVVDVYIQVTQIFQVKDAPFLTSRLDISHPIQFGFDKSFLFIFIPVFPWIRFASGCLWVFSLLLLFSSFVSWICEGFLYVLKQNILTAWVKSKHSKQIQWSFPANCLKINKKKKTVEFIEKIAPFSIFRKIRWFEC